MPRRTPAEPDSWPVETHMREGFSKVEAIRALKRAIIDTFDAAQWRELGITLGETNYISGHSRLLRSLSWGDDDYDQNVHQVLLRLIEIDDDNLGRIEEFVGLRAWLTRNDPTSLKRLYGQVTAQATVSLDGIEDAAEIHNVADLARQAARIRNAIDEDPELAIGSAKELLETVLKTILAEQNPRCPDEIPQLLRRVRNELDLDPHSAAAGANESLRRTLSSLGQLVVGTAEIRNVHGTGHGHARRPELDRAHTRLVVNSAITAATFLLEVWQSRDNSYGQRS